MQLVLSRLEEDGDGVVVVLGSFEGQVEGEAGSGVASLPAGRVIDTSLAAVHIDQPLVHSIAESDRWQSQQKKKRTHHENTHCRLGKMRNDMYTKNLSIRECLLNAKLIDLNSQVKTRC